MTRPSGIVSARLCRYFGDDWFGIGGPRPEVGTLARERVVDRPVARSLARQLDHLEVLHVRGPMCPDELGEDEDVVYIRFHYVSGVGQSIFLRPSGCDPVFAYEKEPALFEMSRLLFERIRILIPRVTTGFRRPAAPHA